MNRGRIRFLQRVFPPATGAAGAMLKELADFLTDQGWAVEVVCAGETEAQSKLGGIQVHQVKAPYHSRNLLMRAWSMVRVRAALERKARELPKPDLVVTLTDPPGLAVAGARVARHHGVPHVHWSQDVYPEIAWQLGVLSRNNPLARRLWKQSSAALKECAAIISISHCMKRILERRGIAPQRIHPISNWTSMEPPEREDPQTIREAFKLSTAPVLLYAGNFGRVHEFQTLLETAALVPDWTFLLVGDGPRKTEIETAILKLSLRNTRRLPRQSANDYARLQSLATAHCVTLAATAAGCVLPSKIYASLPCGKPVIYIGPEASDAHGLAMRCGLSVRNGAAKELAAQLTNWNSIEAERWSHRAKALSADYTLTQRAGEVEAVLLAALNARETKPS